jgi:hypothetical protein
MFFINQYKLCLLLFCSVRLDAQHVTELGSGPYQTYQGPLKVEENLVHPKVFFRNEGSISSSLSFGHLAIGVDLNEAEELATGIEALLRSTRRLLMKPFPGTDDHEMLGTAWTQAAWNRTAARFFQAKTTYNHAIQLFYKDLNDPLVPAVPVAQFERTRRPGQIAKVVPDDQPGRHARSTTTSGPRSKTDRVTSDPFEVFDRIPTFNLSNALIITHGNSSTPERKVQSRVHPSINRFSDLSFEQFLDDDNGTAPNVAPRPPVEYDLPRVDNEMTGHTRGTANNTVVHHRDKRFAIIAGAVLVGGLISTLAVSVTNAIKIAGIDAGSVSQEQADFIVKTLQSHANLLGELQSDLKVATSEIETLRLRGYQNTLAIQATLEHLKTLEMTNLVIDEYERVTNAISIGLTQLLDGRLNMDLVPPETVIPLVNQLKESATKAGLDTPVTDIAAVYGLGCSFVATNPKKLTVLIHLPLTRPNSLMTLYEFLDLGYAIPNTNLSVSIDVESRYLAVNKDRTGFLLLDDVSSCLDLGSLKMCHGQNFLMKSFKKYCISSLFIGRAAEAEEICSMNILPAQARVIQQDRTHYYVFHPVWDVLSIDQCDDPKDNSKRRFRGVSLIELKNGCFGHTADYQLNPLAELGLKLHGSVTFTNRLSLPKLLKGIPIKTLAELYPKPPAQPTKIEDIANTYRHLAKAVNPFQFSWPFHFSALFGTSFIMVGIVCFLIVFCCCREKLPSFCQRRSAAAPGAGPGVNISVGGGASRFDPIPLNDMEEGNFINPPLRSRRNSFSESVRNLARVGVQGAAGGALGAFAKLRGSISRMNLAGRRRRQEDSDYGSERPESENQSSAM